MHNANIQTAVFNYFDVEMPTAAVEECFHIGECYEDVKKWHSYIELSHISDDDLKKELSQYGAWDESELNNRRENELKIIWMAAGNIQEKEEFEQ